MSSLFFKLRKYTVHTYVRLILSRERAVYNVRATNIIPREGGIHRKYTNIFSLEGGIHCMSKQIIPREGGIHDPSIGIFDFLFFAMKRYPIAAKIAVSIGILPRCVLNDFFTHEYERFPDL